MGNYLTIDGGTTNTRIYLVLNGKMVDSVRFGIGSVGGKENSERLKAAVKEGISELLARNSKREDEIERILASGMITSDGGLCPLTHLLAPCGLSELAQASYDCALLEISTIPFTFLRGVRTESDMMRGEETELMGLCKEDSGDTLYVLPGSHTKLIRIDVDGRICEISTELTGEMLRALSEGTILRESVTLQREFDKECLLRGYRRAEEKGLNSALFGVRILDRLEGASSLQTYSFFLGALLSDEIRSLLSAGARRVLVAGKASLRLPTECLLRHRTEAQILSCPEGVIENASALGAIRIFESAER